MLDFIWTRSGHSKNCASLVAVCFLGTRVSKYSPFYLSFGIRLVHHLKIIRCTAVGQHCRAGGLTKGGIMSPCCIARGDWADMAAAGLCRKSSHKM